MIFVHRDSYLELTFDYFLFQIKVSAPRMDVLILFAQKVFVITEVCVYLSVTSQSASAQLDLQENAARSM